MQQNDRRAIGISRLDIADIEQARTDLLDRPDKVYSAGALCLRACDQAQLGGSESAGGQVQQVAT